MFRLKIIIIMRPLFNFLKKIQVKYYCLRDLLNGILQNIYYNKIVNFIVSQCILIHKIYFTPTNALLSYKVVLVF